MKTRSASFFLLAAILAALPGASQPAAKGAAPKKILKVHPKVDAEQECGECHGGKGSAAEAWEASKHGMGLVKCVVCHGSTGKDFAARPGTRACSGCHDPQVASAAKAKKADCFACHAPHALAPKKNFSSPHAK